MQTAQSRQAAPGGPEFPSPGDARRNESRWNAALEPGRLTKGLGWFSIGLGVAQVLAPRRVGRLIGVGDQRPMLRAVGLREIATGVGLLSQRRRKGWLWSRVGGDAMDLALLGMAARNGAMSRNRVAVTAAAVTAITAVDLLSSRRVGREEETGGPVPIHHSLAVNRSPDECYRYWRALENLPQFMRHLESVRETDGRRSHWVASAPGGARVEWDSEITTDEPGRLIAWQSLPGSDMESSGTVRFDSAPGGRGTTVRLDMTYNPPTGPLAHAAAKLFGASPDQLLQEDLRHFKQILETGEVPTTVGQPAGRRDLASRLFRKGEPG